jgi:poly(A) polymerase
MDKRRPHHLHNKVTLFHPDPAALSSHHALLDIIATLAARRDQGVWVCGGTLRDLYLGIDPPDVDLAADGDALALGREAAEMAGARFVPLKEEHATCRLVLEGRWVDITGLRAPNLERDLGLRDFTVNALAWDLGDFLKGLGRVIDPTGGLDDLKKGVLRAAGTNVLRDDPLRVLRAFRFLATHALEPDTELINLLSAAAPSLSEVAKERIGHEWVIMAAGSKAAEGIMGLEKVGALTVLVPALEAGRGVEQNPYHHLDVFGHSIETVNALGAIAFEPGTYWGDLGQEVAVYLARPLRRALAMTAALMHDAGKPPTLRIKEPGWATFYRHDLEGADMARAACRRLGLSKAESGVVAHLVREHMRPFFLMGAARRGQLTKRAVRRLLLAAGDHLPGLMSLAMADTMAGQGPERPPDAEEQLCDLYTQVADLRDQELAEALAAPALINGHDIIDELGLPPGPLVGKILSMVRESQLDGQTHNRDQALSFARRLFESEFNDQE